MKLDLALSALSFLEIASKFHIIAKFVIGD
jgi:hypothetical protein